MTTMQDVVNETKRYLYGGFQDNLNVLAASVTSTTGDTVKLSDSLKGVGRGSVIEVGLEQMYVRSVVEDTKTATVLRGHGGTTATTHDGGDIASINPSYSTNDIFGACLDEISSLQGSGLYQFDTQEFDFTNDRVYDLTLDTTNRTPLFVQSAMYERSQRYASWAPTRVELLRDMDEDDFASTYGLKVVGRPRVGSDYLNSASAVGMRATIAFSLGRPSALTDEVEDFGIDPHVRPIISVGAAWRMVIGKEARRVNPDSSHGSRRAEEVPPGSISFLGRAMNGMRNDLIKDALEHQMKRYPYMQEL